MKLKHTKSIKSIKPTKKMIKEFLDRYVKNCSVVEIMENNFTTIHELEFPFQISEPIEQFLTKLSLKKYISLKYNNNFE
jgi:uncharacterized protein YaaR (DUF327 family)